MNKIVQGDALQVLKTLLDEIVDCVITSPPYWGLRDYGVEKQLGLEKTPEEYVANLVKVFQEVKRVLKKEGTVWLNLGDSYANTKVGNTETKKNPKVVTDTFKKELPPGLKPKDLVGIPWRVAFALQADGWYLRQDIIWAKPNPMPESVIDRCTKSHEYIFLLAKSPKYYFDNEAIKEKASTPAGDPRNKRTKRNGEDVVTTKKRGYDTQAGTPEPGKRNKRSVWTVTTKPFKEAHFATFPEDLIVPMVKAGCPEGGVVLDPFMGSGTTVLVAQKLKRDWLGIELNPEYIKIAKKRLRQQILI